jgi:kinetochore protein Mis12/MTW1
MYVFYSLLICYQSPNAVMSMQQRCLKRLYVRARYASTARRRRAEHRLSQLSLLKSPSLNLLSTIPQKLTEMYQSASSLPPMDSSSLPIMLVDPGKRPWETSKTGYVNWAVGQLVERTKEEEGRSSDKGSSTFDALSVKVEDIGSADGLRGLLVKSDGAVSDC